MDDKDELPKLRAELTRLQSPAPAGGGAVPDWEECTRIANEAQEKTGKSIWPSTVEAILRVYLASRLPALKTGL